MKISMIPAAISFVCLTAVGLSAQTRNISIPITDSSPAECPLRIVGNVSLEEEAFADKMIIRDAGLDAAVINASSKAIIAYEFTMDVSPERGEGSHEQYKDDRFFGSELQPGSQYLLQENHGRTQVVPPSKLTSVFQPARAQARVLFVEFVDGSRFGTSKWAAGLSTERMRAISRLNAFVKTYENGGNAPLAEALINSSRTQDPDEPFGTAASVLAYRIKGILDSSGSTAAVAEIHRVLENASQRKSIM
jgi:hypothetical protein